MVFLPVACLATFYDLKIIKYLSTILKQHPVSFSFHTGFALALLSFLQIPFFNPTQFPLLPLSFLHMRNNSSLHLSCHCSMLVFNPLSLYTPMFILLGELVPALVCKNPLLVGSLHFPAHYFIFFNLILIIKPTFLFYDFYFTSKILFICYSEV